MAYTKQNWECGDLITVDKMNHIEDGIEAASSGGVLTVNVVNTDPALNQSRSEAPLLRVDTNAWLDKTWQQIHDAFPNVRLNIAGSSAGVATFSWAVYSDGYYTVKDTCRETTFETTSADGYPKAMM